MLNSKLIYERNSVWGTEKCPFKGGCPKLSTYLISRLSASLLKRETDDIHWASEFAGKWKDDCSADEIVTDIREARTSNREIEL